MVQLRNRPRGVLRAPLGLCVFALTLLPRSIGYQDLVSLMAQQSELQQRARAHMLASPFGTIHAATFSFPQPVGTQIPEPPATQFASIGTYDPETTGSLGRDGGIGGDIPFNRPRVDFPQVNRRLKGDLLISRPHEDGTAPDGTRDLTPGKVKTVSFPRPSDPSEQPPQAGDAPIASEPPPAPQPISAPQPQPISAKPGATSEAQTDAAIRLGRLYFGNVIDDGVGAIQPWPDDEQLVIEQPTQDPDLKTSALVTMASSDFNFEYGVDPAGAAGIGKDAGRGSSCVWRDGRRQGRGDRQRPPPAHAGGAAQPRRQVTAQVGEVPRRSDLFRGAR